MEGGGWLHIPSYCCLWLHCPWHQTFLLLSGSEQVVSVEDRPCVIEFQGLRGKVLVKASRTERMDPQPIGDSLHRVM